MTRRPFLHHRDPVQRASTVMAAAVASVAERHRRAGVDDHRLGSTDPRETLDYLHRLPRRQLRADPVPGGRHDIEDGLTIVLALRLQLDDIEARLIEACPETGFPRRRAAAVLGIDSKSGVRDRARRIRRYLPAARPAAGSAGTAVKSSVDRELAAQLQPAADDAQLRDLVQRLIEAELPQDKDVLEDVDDLATALTVWRPGGPAPHTVRDDLLLLVVSLRTCGADLSDEVLGLIAEVRRLGPDRA